MAYTEFYVQTTGDNLNAGSTTDNTALFTYAGGTFVRSTGVFTVASGNPSGDGVAVGMFASVYTTAGATVATCVGRITARDATTITISLTALAGATSTVSESAGAATCKVGGAWAGPSGTVIHPFAFAVAALNDGTNLVPRVNLKGGTSYSVTAGIDHNKAGVHWQGYTTTIDDGGKATIDGGESGAAYTLFTSSANQNIYEDLIWAHNGATGGTSGTHGVITTAARNSYHRCVCLGMRASGFYCATAAQFIECEAYDCNRANTTGIGAFYAGGTGLTLVRCYAHHNAGSNGHGFYLDQSILILGCISHSNGGSGFYSTADQLLSVVQCDSYNNTGSGFRSVSAAGTLTFNMQNCNFVKNSRYGIECDTTSRYGFIFNCGFGAGTQANTLGQITANLAPVQIEGTVTYANDVTPWVNPANGDFRINLAAAQNTGRGVFTQTYTSESARNTVGYPDIGAAFAAAGGDGYLLISN